MNGWYDVGDSTVRVLVVDVGSGGKDLPSSGERGSDGESGKLSNVVQYE